MKKIIATALLLVLLLPSCGQPQNQAPAFLEQQFVFTADYTIDVMEGTLSYSQTGVESCELKFLAPDTIAGMTLSMQSGMVTTTFHGISAEANAADLKRGNPAKAIFNLLSDAKKGAAAVRDDQKTGDVIYEYADGATIVVYGGIPKRMAIPAAGISIKITGFEAV